MGTHAGTAVRGQGQSATIDVMSSGDEPVSREAWLALSVATAASFLVVLDVSVVNVALPSIAADLDATTAELPWVVSGYNISLASLLLLAGRIADRKGRRATFTAGLWLFLLGSALCGLATSPQFLIGARMLQAAGGAFLTPASLAMVLPQFPLARRGVAIGVWGAMGALGAAFGPTVGALLIDAWSWRLIFLINVPLGIAVAVAARRLVPESRDDTAAGPLDLIGVPVGVIGVGLVMLGIVRTEQHGWVDATVWALILAGAALLPFVVWRSARHPGPLLDLTLFRVRSFSVATGAFWIYSLAFTAGFLLNSFLFQRVWGMSVLATGFGLTPTPIVAALASVRLGGLADRVGHRWLIAAGSMLAAASYGWMWLTFSADPEYVFVYLLPAVPMGIGLGSTIAGFQSAAMSEVAPHQFASANATLRTVQQIGYAIGISVSVTLAAGFTVDGLERAYLWVIVCFALSGVVMAARYPSGSAAQRQAEQASA